MLEKGILELLRSFIWPSVMWGGSVSKVLDSSMTLAYGAIGLAIPSHMSANVLTKLGKPQFLLECSAKVLMSNSFRQKLSIALFACVGPQQQGLLTAIVSGKNVTMDALAYYAKDDPNLSLLLMRGWKRP